MHVNKVHHVTTITRVAANLGEDEDWLCEVASEMEIEDGVIWVYGIGEALQDIAEDAQHADINTTRKHYIVPSVETSRRVAKQRVAHRQTKVDKT